MADSYAQCQVLFAESPKSEPANEYSSPYLYEYQDLLQTLYQQKLPDNSFQASHLNPQNLPQNLTSEPPHELIVVDSMSYEAQDYILLEFLNSLQNQLTQGGFALIRGLSWLQKEEIEQAQRRYPNSFLSTQLDVTWVELEETKMFYREQDIVVEGLPPALKKVPENTYLVLLKKF